MIKINLPIFAHPNARRYAAGNPKRLTGSAEQPSRKGVPARDESGDGKSAGGGEREIRHYSARLPRREDGEDFGLMAEWLGKGLQNLVQRFESASDLTETALQKFATRFSV